MTDREAGKIGYSGSTHWKPICECTRRVAQSTESIRGFSAPPANGAIVSGIKAAEMILSQTIYH